MQVEEIRDIIFLLICVESGGGGPSVLFQFSKSFQYQFLYSIWIPFSFSFYKV